MLQKINKRIEELQAKRQKTAQDEAILKLEEKEAEDKLNEIRNKISSNLWTNHEESKELEDLLVAKKIIENLERTEEEKENE